jgi:hypothetical protein
MFGNATFATKVWHITSERPVDGSSECEPKGRYGTCSVWLYARDGGIYPYKLSYQSSGGKYTIIEFLETGVE